MMNPASATQAGQHVGAVRACTLGRITRNPWTCAGRLAPSSGRLGTRNALPTCDHFPDSHAEPARSSVTAPRRPACLRPPRFETGGQLGLAQSTAGSSSTRGKVKGSARTCGNFMGPASKSGLQNDATVSADYSDGCGTDMGPKRQVYGFRRSVVCDWTHKVAALATLCVPTENSLHLLRLSMGLQRHYAFQSERLYTCYTCWDRASCRKPGAI